MKFARPRERSVEGRSPKDPTGGHMNTLHTSQDKDVEGQDEDKELSRREGREIEGKEGYVGHMYGRVPIWKLRRQLQNRYWRKQFAL